MKECLTRIRPLDGGFRFSDAYWGPRLESLYRVTLKDTFDKLEKDGVIENYRDLAAGRLGHHRGMPWHDGLLLETVRGAADYLTREKDDGIVDRVEGYVDAIEAAQLSSGGGYLSTYTQLDRPTMRYGMNGGSILWQHDLYNNGCLFEAGAHWYLATGKTRLLACAVRCANALSAAIGAPPREWVVPGHPLPEYALLELIDLVDSEPDLPDRLGVSADVDAWRVLADFWVRGRGFHAHRRNHPQYMGEYSQDHVPIHQQVQAVGHAVRATLYYTGATRLAMAQGDRQLLEDSVRLWENATERKLHINGGVGATHFEEKFGEDYDLNNGAYLETCASVGLVFWSDALNRATGDGRYFEPADRAIWNLMLSSVSQSGVNYFYRNPLESDGTDHRWAWHDCPCCPPMIAKLFGMLDRLAAGQDDGGVYVNLLAGGDLTARLAGGDARLTLRSSLPWRGEWTAKVEAAPEGFALRVRLPEWLSAPAWTLNGEPVEPEIADGYAVFRLRPGDALTLEDPLPVRRMEAHPQAACDRGKVAVMRGPLVYCAEGVDNPDGVDATLAEPPRFDVVMRPDLPGGAAALTARTAEGGRLTLVPLNIWDNRAAGPMRVWFPQAGKDEKWNSEGWAHRLYRPYIDK